VTGLAAMERVVMGIDLTGVGLRNQPPKRHLRRCLPWIA
jgi:hypothetical protein